MEIRTLVALIYLTASIATPCVAGKGCWQRMINCFSPRGTSGPRPDWDHCGRVNSPAAMKDLKQRLKATGAWEAMPGSLPWVVGITDPHTGSYLCDGVLIDSPLFTENKDTEFVITTAHCFEKNWQIVRVTAGAHYLFGSDGAQIVDGVVILHEDYNSTSRLHDIATIKLLSRITFGLAVQSICLPYANQKISSGDITITAGFGVDMRGVGRPTRAMRMVITEKVTNIQCRRVYVQYNKHIMICARAAGTNARLGDYGSPMFILKKDIFILHGLASITSDRTSPSVFTRVAKYTEWILHKTATVQFRL